MSQFPNEYEAVLSRGDPAGSSAPARDGNLTVYDWVDDQYKLLKAADVVICRAGHGIMMKAMTFGKPMILIPIPDHTEQYGNAKRALKLGIAELVPQRAVDAKRLLDSARRLLNSPSLGLQELRQGMVGVDAIETAIRCIVELGAKSPPW